MRIRLLAFASAADAVGAGEQELELPAGCTVATLKATLATRHTALAPLLPRMAVAVDGEVVGDEAVVADGAEVALLPPVSGGNAPPPERADVRLSETPLDAAAVAAAVAGPGRGAQVLFVGTVRDRHAGRPVARLTYTAYRSMAERRLRQLAAELEQKHGARVAIVHRLGTLAPGEASVVIAAAAPHREAAYAASREALERLKREVPVWKREHYADGAVSWREEEPLLLAGTMPIP
ncbi:MAG TPA: molybdenum cofactor biosynthesis protein MoaE [Thermoanaerobaculia bacterium]|jgi:molybdopterin synthase catalytic subunit|nr:molybdenum cofactor biosynthesis protein MoaE [Thermoanaerobaculia bacterium]